MSPNALLFGASETPKAFGGVTVVPIRCKSETENPKGSPEVSFIYVSAESTWAELDS